MEVLQQINEIKRGLISWYDFGDHAGILYVDDTVDIMDHGFVETHRGEYDYVICVEKPETVVDPECMLKQIKDILKDTGILLLGMNNRLGIRYFCGDKDRYSGSVFGAIYKKGDNNDKGRLYSGEEIREMLSEAGFVKQKIYSVLSNLDNPTHIFAESYKPNEDIANRLFPAYNSPETVFLKEELLYRDMIDNGMFHAMANSYLIEAAVDEGTALSDAVQITNTLDRNPEDAFITVLRENGTVIKKSVHPEGRKRFKYMLTYAEDLKEHDLEVIDMELTDEGLTMPFIEAETGQLALRNALMQDADEFLKMLDDFRDCIIQSSQVEYEDVELGPIVRYGYIDMVPLNSFYIDGTYVFFDQEFRMEHYPVNAIIARMIATLYFGNENLRTFMDIDDLYRRYGLYEKKSLWYQMEMDFLKPLRNEKLLAGYYAGIRRNNEVTRKNTERMNFSADRYLSIFSEVFAGSETKDIYVFGSGRFAARFMDWYGPILPVKGILDNDRDKWGKHLYGIEIGSPDIIGTLKEGSYKIIICVKDYMPIIKQLDKMRVSDYSVYNGRTVFPRRLGLSGEIPDIDKEKINDNNQDKKPYHIGYISGTFDLFHKGHLNLLRRAKDRCDYLIVGVVSDEGVRKFKHTEPFIPFEERIEIISSCRYVDEAVKIPLENRDIRSAYALYHFDCQFCGSDYYDDPVFMNDREWLRAQGSELEILPYTESTSSSKIKSLIEDRLL